MKAEGTLPSNFFETVAVAAVIVLLWGSGLNAFFALDDFVLLEGSLRTWHNSSVAEWLRQVFLGTGLIDYNYRPLSTHVVFLVLQRLFGPNPVAFHALSLLLLLLTSLGVGALARLLGVGRGPALVASVFYATRDALFAVGSWASGVQDGLMAACAVGSAWAVAVQARSRRWWCAPLSLLLFAGSLLSKETAMVVPLLVTLIAWGAARAPERSKRWREAVRLSAGHWVVLGVYLLVRVGVVGIDLTIYPIGIGDAALLRPGAYSFWTLVAGYLWPWWDPDRARGFLLSSVLGWALLVVIAVGLFLGRKKREPSRQRAMVTGFLWWAAGALFLCLQKQRFQMYYLALPAAGMGLALAAWVDGWQGEGRWARRWRVLLTGGAALCLLSGAVMIVLKLRGTVSSGVFYTPADGAYYERMYQDIASIAGAAANYERVVFVNFVDFDTIRANRGDTGYGQASIAAAMLRVMLRKPDLEVFYVATEDSALPPPDRAPPNMVGRSFLRDGLRPTDLLVRYNAASQRFERPAATR